MIAVASLLDTKHTDIVNTIIGDFEKEFSIKQVQATPFPHITYLITEAYNLEILKKYLERFCQTGKSFHVYTTGIGVFPGEHPVVYIPVLRTPPLNKFHSQLYKDISKLSTETVSYSKPKLWLPHISLALGDTTLEMMTPMFKYLAQYDFNWEIKIEKMSIFKQDASGTGFEKAAEYYLSNTVMS